MSSPSSRDFTFGRVTAALLVHARTCDWSFERFVAAFHMVAFPDIAVDNGDKRIIEAEVERVLADPGFLPPGHAKILRIEADKILREARS